jgi:[acyl-carrier-protein] S-malonyltransferase
VAFPGQGAPDLEGVRRLIGADAEAPARVGRLLTDRALEEACVSGRSDRLSETLVQQPLLGVASALCYEALEASVGDALDAAVHIGASLGELFAATAAGAMSWETAIAVARERARLMQEASGSRGAMASVFALPLREVTEVCLAIPGVVGVASDVADGQVVISGEVAAVEAACRICHERSGSRPLRLPISIAAHSPLMADALGPFRRELAKRPLGAPRRAVWSCLDLLPLRSADAVRERLAEQLVRPVRWREVVELLRQRGISMIVGIGPAASLLRQIARTQPDLRIQVASDPQSVAETARAIHQTLEGDQK